MFQNKQKVRAVSGGDPTRVVKVRNVPGGDAARYPKLTLGGESGRHQQVQAVSGGDATRYPIVDLTTEAFQFHAPLRTSVVLERGTVAASYTRATVATVKDFEGNIRNVLSGEVRFEGQRRVRNLISVTRSDTPLAGYGWTPTSGSGGTGSNVGGADDPFGGTDASTITKTNASGFSGIFGSYASAVVGKIYIGSIWIRRRTGTGVVNLRTLNNTDVDISSALTTSWQRFATAAAAASSTTQYLVVTVVTDGDAVDLYGGQIEDVTGQSNQNPSEYVSVGVLSSPFHGAMVDGVKYFDYENGNTVASNVVTEARGAAISQTAAGYLAEAASTNLVLQSSNFGTTWVAYGPPTRSAAAAYCGDIALDLIGDDSAVADENYSQTITFTADAQKSISFLVKQGTSTSSLVSLRDTTAPADRLMVTITWSGGAPVLTYTTGSSERASEALGNGVYRCFALTTSVTAANTNSLRFYPATDAALSVANTGDCYFGGVQAENATVASSLMPTTTATVTRNLDNETYPGAGNISATEGTVYAEVYFNGPTGIAQVVCELGDGTANERITLSRSSAGNMTVDVVDGGVSQASLNLGAAANGQLHKVAFRYKANDFAGSLNGAAVVTDTAGTLPTVTTIYTGTQQGTTTPALSPIKNLRIAQTALTSAELIAVTI